MSVPSLHQHPDSQPGGIHEHDGGDWRHYHRLDDNGALTYEPFHEHPHSHEGPAYVGNHNHRFIMKRVERLQWAIGWLALAVLGLVIGLVLAGQ